MKTLTEALRRYRQIQNVCVLGAGPSLDRFVHDRAYFTKRFDVVIGVNWIFEVFDVTYNVVTHNEPLIEMVAEKNVPSGLVYSRLTSDVGYQAKNIYVENGIVFEPFADLWCGQSTIIAALHMGALLNPMQIYLAGVDRKLEKGDTGKMYVEGYRMGKEGRKRPSDWHFMAWSDVVTLQITGLSNMLGCKFLNFDGEIK